MNFQNSFFKNLITGIYIAITAMVITKFLNAIIDQGSYRIVIGYVDMAFALAGAVVYALIRIYNHKMGISQKDI